MPSNALSKSITERICWIRVNYCGEASASSNHMVASRRRRAFLLCSFSEQVHNSAYPLMKPATKRANWIPFPNPIKEDRDPIGSGSLNPTTL